jgi:molybdopterin/thiamine biosynthesis adenylyltransferase
MAIKSWFEVMPKRLQDELNALTALGIEYEEDSKAKSQGILRLSLKIEGLNPAFEFPEKTSLVELIAVYPDLYPYFRPEVYAYNLTLPRHQNFVSKNLCLIPRNTDAWEPEWTLAEFLKSQLTKVLDKGTVTDNKVISEDPDEQAEPVSEYYVGPNNPVIFDSSAFDSEELLATKEKITYLGKTQVGIPKHVDLNTRLAILQSISPTGVTLNSLPPALEDLFDRRIEGSIYHLSAPPPTGSPKEDLNWLRNLLKEEGKKFSLPKKPILLKRNMQLKGVVGLCFPEEVSPGKFGIGWLFLIVGTVKIQKPIGTKRIETNEEVARYARAARVSKDDLKVRAPRLMPLTEKKIAVVGLGAVGAPSVLEFARNRVSELRILDFDTVEPSTTVRWPFGLAEAGVQKTDALKSFIEAHYPSTVVTAFNKKIGGVRMDGTNPLYEGLTHDQEIMDKLLEGVSLLYDASAETGVNHFLSEEAKRRGIPYVCVSTTLGAWGGIVMRVVPGETEGCWMCYQHAKTKGKITLPPSDISGEIQPNGCGDITFTGASFDLQNISLAGVRLSISTLCSGHGSDAYQDMKWDVGVLSLVDKEQLPIPPSWVSYSLKRDSECPYCAE